MVPLAFPGQTGSYEGRLMVHIAYPGTDRKLLRQTSAFQTAWTRHKDMSNVFHLTFIV